MAGASEVLGSPLYARRAIRSKPRELRFSLALPIDGDLTEKRRLFNARQWGRAVASAHGQLEIVIPLPRPWRPVSSRLATAFDDPRAGPDSVTAERADDSVLMGVPGSHDRLQRSRRLRSPDAARWGAPARCRWPAAAVLRTQGVAPFYVASDSIAATRLATMSSQPYVRAR
jgi:hypothetical protein